MIQRQKRMVAKAAARAATLKIFPLSFCYPRKGLLTIAKALIELGQRHSVSDQIDVKDALQSTPSVP